MSNATPGASPRSSAAPSASPFQPSPGQSVFLGVGFDQKRARRQALIVLLAGLLLTGLVVGGLTWRRVAAQTTRTELAAVRHATLLHDRVQSAAAGLITAVTWVLQGNGQVGHFAHYAKVLLPAYPGLMAMDLAPDAVVRTVAPPGLLAGMVGRNLLHEPAMKPVAAGAIQSRNLYFGPPLMVASNTPAIPVRVPVFLPGATGGLRLWGLVGGYLDLRQIERGARLEKLAAQGCRYSLEVVAGAEQAPVHVSGVADVSAGAVVQEVHFPGVTWRLAVWPASPAASAWRVALDCLPGVIISLLAAALVGAVGRGRQAAAAALQALAEKGRAGERSNALLEGVPDPVILTKLDGRVISLNAAAEKAFGYQRGELLGRPLATLLPAGKVETADDQAQFSLPAAGPLTARHKDGRELIVTVHTGRIEGAGNGGPLLCHTLHLVEPGAPAAPAVLPEPAPEPVREVAPALAVIEELETLQRRWRAVTGGLRDWESWLDVDGRPQWIGGPVQSFTGYPADELLKLADYPLPLAIEEDRDALREVMLSAMQGASGSNFEFRVRRRDGQIRRVVMSWRPVTDEQRRPLGFRTTIRPAAQAVAVQAVEPTPAAPEDEKSETLDLALEHAGIGIWDWDLTSGRNVWDERMLRLFALSPEEFGQSSDPWRRRLHPEDEERFDAAVESARGAEGVFEVEFRIQLPDGGLRSLACKGRLKRNAEGQPERLIGATWDTTMLRQVEEELRRNHTLLQDLLAETRALIHVKDPAGRYLFANPAWGEGFGTTPAEVSGAGDATLLPPELAEHIGEADRRVATRLEAERRIETLTLGGVSRRFLFERFPLLDGGERLAAVVSIATELPEGGPEPGGESDQSDSPDKSDPSDPSDAPDLPAPELPPPRKARRQAARKKRARPVPEGKSQTLLPGFAAPRAEPGPSSSAANSPLDLAAVAEQLGVPVSEVGARLADFANEHQRVLRELREAMEEENLAEARSLSHALAEAAGTHGVESLRRLAKTIELAIRYGEGNLPSMLAELETEAERVFAEIAE